MADGLESRRSCVIGHVDEIGEIGATRADGMMHRGAYALVRGWVLHDRYREPVESLTVAIGGKPVRAIVGLPRPDIAAQFGQAAMGAGFYAIVPLVAPAGSYEVTFEASGRGEVLQCDICAQVSIRTSASPLDGKRERGDRWAFAIDGIHLDDGTSAESIGGEYIVEESQSHAFIKAWAIDLLNEAPPEMMIARCGGTYLSVIDGIVRNDAATQHGLPEAARCGFIIPVRPSLFSSETIELFAAAIDGTYTALGSVRMRRSCGLSPWKLPAYAAVAGCIDEVLVNGAAQSSIDVVHVMRADTVTIRGWAVDEAGPRLTGGVCALVNGTIVDAVRRGLRPDIAALYQCESVRESQFVLTLPPATLPEGRHTILLLALSARGDAAGEFGGALVVECLPATA